MKRIKLLAVIAAMTICGTMSAQENFFKVSYSNVEIKASAGGISLTQNLNGLSVGVSQARVLPCELPFLYEYGADLLMAFGDNKSTLVSAVVPVNLMYRLDLGQIQLIPFAGLNLTAHIIGQNKYDDYTYNWFKKSEGVEASNRFQLGAQFGAKALYGKYFLGLSYQPSLTNFDDNTSLNILNVSVGLTF